MTRRDTIIVAVLINAGLLTVLFITALTSNDDDFIDVNNKYVQKELPKMEEPVAVAAEPPAPPPMLIEKKKEETPSPIVETPTPAPPPALVKAEKKEEVITHKLPEPALSEKKEEKPKPEVKKAAKDYKEIIVQKGDNLEKIAKEHNTTVQEIIRLNDLPNSFLRIGQVLKIPKASAPKETVKVSKKNPENAEYYIVKVGDNPWTIAMKHHIKVDDLLRLNNLDEKKARKLKPGDKLRIR